MEKIDGKPRGALCICDCGKEKLLITYNLTKTGNPTRSCGCLLTTYLVNLNKSRKGILKLPYGHSALNYVLKNYKNNAKERGLQWSLSKEICYKLLTSNCFYCNIPPQFMSKEMSYEYKWNGLDRQDDTKGYFADNVVTCCKMCNIAKNNYTLKEFKEWINRVYNHLNSTNK